MTELFPIGIEEQIAAVEREIALRRRVYPRRVADRKMTQALAEKQVAAMQAVLDTLLELRVSGPSLCDDCPPVNYPTDKTRCLPCPRRKGETACLSALATNEPCLPDSLRRCTICGFIVDTQYAASFAAEAVAAERGAVRANRRWRAMMSAVCHSGPVSEKPPPCWDDRSCNTPIACFLRGCRRPGYQNPEIVPGPVSGTAP